MDAACQERCAAAQKSATVKLANVEDDDVKGRP